jgi:hypothetical protein
MTNSDELYPASATDAGFGYGLCVSCTQAYACGIGEWEMSDEYVLFIKFLRRSTRYEHKWLQSFEASVSTTVIASKLGYVEGLSNDGSRELFGRIGGKIRSFVKKYKYRWDVTMVLVTGTVAFI